MKDTKKKAKTMTSFNFDLETFEKFKSICRRDDKSMTDRLEEFMSSEIKIHGDGNPQYTVDPFFETPNFRAFPAFMRSRDDWKEYIEGAEESELKEILGQSQTILHYAEKKLKYGSTTVTVY